jgi:hypothetical protein
VLAATELSIKMQERRKRKYVRTGSASESEYDPQSSGVHFGKPEGDPQESIDHPQKPIDHREEPERSQSDSRESERNPCKPEKDFDFCQEEVVPLIVKWPGMEVSGCPAIPQYATAASAVENANLV